MGAGHDVQRADLDIGKIGVSSSASLPDFKDPCFYRMTNMDHITVCICTFKRPGMLKELLSTMENQETDNLFRYSIVVIDNDSAESARDTVSSIQKKSEIRIGYFVEPDQNIALARNKAIENSEGNFIAFIDDDELPGDHWLLELRNAYYRFKVDGVLGPVVPKYKVKPPKWVMEGKFYERPSHKTGTILDWKNTRTGNVLLDRNIFREKENIFRPEFGRGGEDRDFFRRMIGKKYRFVWCEEAQVHETITQERFKRIFMIKRALLRGKIRYDDSLVNLLKSFMAVPVYTLGLPVFLLLGHHVFMKYVVKNFDHIGKILDFLGFDVVKQKYVTD